MEKKKQSEELASSRREMLKKAGVASAFIAPTIVSFSIPSLARENSTPLLVKAQVRANRNVPLILQISHPPMFE